MADEVGDEEAVDEVNSQAEQGKPKGQTHKKWKTRGVATDKVSILVECPRPIHDELKHYARRTRVAMKRLLLECFLDSLPPEKADRLRSTLGPLSTAARIDMAMRQSDRMTRPRCLDCNRQHEMMPGPGPWHATDCAQWRKRPTVFVDGEKE